MKILLIILSVIVTLIVLFFILALFIKKSYSIQRTITINKPVQDVFNYIKHLKNQDNFNKWAMTDPGKKKDFKGADGTVGFVYAWDGNKKAGKGEQEIIKITEGQKLEVEIRFIRPFAAVAQTPFITESLAGNQTKLTWGMSSQMKYPMNFMLGVMDMDKLLGKDIETSLLTLKGILEKN